MILKIPQIFSGYKKMVYISDNEISHVLFYEDIYKLSTVANISSSRSPQFIEYIFSTHSQVEEDINELAERQGILIECMKKNDGKCEVKVTDDVIDPPQGLIKIWINQPIKYIEEYDDGCMNLYFGLAKLFISRDKINIRIENVFEKPEVYLLQNWADIQKYINNYH